MMRTQARGVARRILRWRLGDGEDLRAEFLEYLARALLQAAQHREQDRERRHADAKGEERKARAAGARAHVVKNIAQRRAQSPVHDVRSSSRPSRQMRWRVA